METRHQRGKKGKHLQPFHKDRTDFLSDKAGQPSI